MNDVIDMNDWNATSTKGTKRISRGEQKNEYGNKAFGYSWRYKGLTESKQKIIKSVLLNIILKINKLL